MTLNEGEVAPPPEIFMVPILISKVGEVRVSALTSVEKTAVKNEQSITIDIRYLIAKSPF